MDSDLTICDSNKFKLKNKELWTLVNIENKSIIRCAKIYVNKDNFGNKFIFIENNNIYPLWFVDSEEKAIKALQNNTHPFYISQYQTPSTELIDITKYKIIKTT